MSDVSIVLVGLSITMGMVLLALWYLRSSLFAVLIDLCGTSERARFWTNFSNVTLFLVPFTLALDYRPGANGNESGVFAIFDQIKWAIVGLIASVFILGMVLSSYISKQKVSTGGGEPTPYREAP